MIKFCNGIDESKVIFFREFKIIIDEDFFKCCLILEGVIKCFRGFVKGIFLRIFFSIILF